MSVEFGEFFRALHERDPFPWQERLAAQVLRDGWPDVIDLPTASGKTSCIDVAIYCLAVAPIMPRRIFFVVDRRIIVDDTYQRYEQSSRKLKVATGGPLKIIADGLRKVGDSETPLDVYQLRGGIYRDTSWVRSPLQPTIVTSTVDQTGSRLLFRGYGVSPNTWPIHAGLIANDALILLDEAHCSRAFSQTLQAIDRYRSGGWNAEKATLPFHAVEMTATPSRSGTFTRFELDDDDRQNEFLKRRLSARKHVTLHGVHAKPSDSKAIAKEVAKQALEMAADQSRTRNVAIVNRIATAKEVERILRQKLNRGAGETERDDGVEVSLLIGRMRPLDRDDMMSKLEPFRAGTARDENGRQRFLVSTQCIEVGADLDFDSLVTEGASIDALMQRFGRLDRLGELAGGAIGRIVMPAKAVGAKDADPIYGRPLEKTWAWLEQIRTDDGSIDFGIDSEPATTRTITERLRELEPSEADEMRRLGAPAPKLLPSHLDALCQTSPTPHADPEVGLFLHGRDEGPADIQVIWRADLEETSNESWKEAVLACPPSSAEAMPVRFSTFLRWLRDGDMNTTASAGATDDTDIEGVPETEQERNSSSDRTVKAVRWRGNDSDLLELGAGRRRLRPGDTIVLPVSAGGWEEFGHIPPAGLSNGEKKAPLDFGDRAALVSRSQCQLRIHSALLAQWPGSDESDAKAELRGICAEPERADLETLRAALRAYAESGAVSEGHWLRDLIGRVLRGRGLRIAAHPSGKGVIVLGKRGRSGVAEDAGDDFLSEQVETPLDRHLDNVRDTAFRLARVVTPKHKDIYARAGSLHDAGKADVRFQAVLRGGDLFAAQMSPVMLAKGALRTQGRFMKAKALSGLPKGFRHELLSLQFAERELEGMDGADRELLLHLIASHHGRCRPFAPVIEDPSPPRVSWKEYSLDSDWRLSHGTQLLSSGVSRRFWSLNRRFGWWGLAYLEALFRVSDWIASAQEYSLDEPAEEVAVV